MGIRWAHQQLLLVELSSDDASRASINIIFFSIILFASKAQKEPQNCIIALLFRAEAAAIMTGAGAKRNMKWNILNIDWLSIIMQWLGEKREFRNLSTVHWRTKARRFVR